ncbi:MAG: polysulfide reductase NrfD [Rhodospirillales bacterium]|nr:polysulfide reductase NrfD [Rhodospirillales bacterium]
MAILDSRYEQLIDDLNSEYRPQREWAEGRGFFLIVGHFLVGLAAGAWLFGLALSDTFSLVGAFILAGLGGLAHLVNIARPERVLRMMTQARTSWVSRGFWGLAFFLGGAVLYLPHQVWPEISPLSAPWLIEIGRDLSIVGAIIMIGYMGFVYTASKGIPFWNSTLHPVLYITYAARGGIAAILLSTAFSGAAYSNDANLLGAWLATTAFVAILWILEIQGAYASRDGSAIKSVNDILSGRLAIAFYAGTLIVGLILPAVLIAGIVAPISPSIMGLVGITSVIGDFFMKYSSIKAGVYVPLRLP